MSGGFDLDLGRAPLGFPWVFGFIVPFGEFEISRSFECYHPWEVIMKRRGPSIFDGAVFCSLWGTPGGNLGVAVDFSGCCRLRAPPVESLISDLPELVRYIYVGVSARLC